MPSLLTTASPVRAAIRGFTFAACILSLLSLLDLPLDPRFSLVLLAVIGLSSSVAFYDAKSPGNSRRAVEILMRNVYWDFADAAPSNVDEFISSVSACQPEGTEWSPNRPVLDFGPVEVHFALFHRDADVEQRVLLDPPAEDAWTQAQLLHALHRHIDVTALGDAVFFEGLIHLNSNKYRLLLGS